jgi:hypothetical protein
MGLLLTSRRLSWTFSTPSTPRDVLTILGSVKLVRLSEMSKQFKLKEHHTTYIKFQQLVEKAEELGLTLSFIGDVCILTDEEKPGIDFRVEDIEDNTSVGSFPHGTEIKIVYRE